MKKSQFSDKFHTKPVEWIRTILRKNPSPILFLGAGASWNSGIPSAGELSLEILKLGIRLERNLDMSYQNLTEKDCRDWLKQKPWFCTKKNLEDLFPVVVKNILNVPSERQDYLNQFVRSNVIPSRGYEGLVNLMNRGFIETILTSNFDQCISKAMEKFKIPQKINIIETQSDMVKFSTAPLIPQLIYLHGSIDHYTDKVIETDVHKLEDTLLENIPTLLRDHPLIVVGYRGAERSIMKNLLLDQLDFTNKFRFGIYWCLLESIGENDLPEYVLELNDKACGSFNIVQIKGFDELLYDELYDPLLKLEI